MEAQKYSGDAAKAPEKPWPTWGVGGVLHTADKMPQQQNMVRSSCCRGGRYPSVVSQTSNHLIPSILRRYRLPLLRFHLLNHWSRPLEGPFLHPLPLLLTLPLQAIPVRSPCGRGGHPLLVFIHLLLVFQNPERMVFDATKKMQWPSCRALLGQLL